MKMQYSSITTTTVLTAFITAVAAPATFAQSHPFEGFWFNEQKKTKIQVYQAADGAYAAKLIWFTPPNGEDMRTKVDKRNPNEALRNRPLLGSNIVYGLRPTGKNEYEKGKAYDPSSGKTYDCKVTVHSPQKMTMRGFIGFSLIGKSVEWVRVSN